MTGPGVAETRRPADTVSVLTYRMGFQGANAAANVHGGWIMKLCDDAAAIAATRHAGGRVVTATVDSMTFRSTVHVGDLVTLRATVNAAWRTSMEVGVRLRRHRRRPSWRSCARACRPTSPQRPSARRREAGPGAPA